MQFFYFPFISSSPREMKASFGRSQAMRAIRALVMVVEDGGNEGDVSRLRLLDTPAVFRALMIGSRMIFG